MKCIKWLVSGVFAAVLFVSTAVASPSTNAPVVKNVDDSQWTLSLSGAGSTATKGDAASAFGGEVSLGHTGKLILPLEAGVRQGFNYSSADSGKAILSTRGFVDFTLLRLGNIEFDAGANIGTEYGNTALNFTGGPEAIVRVYLKKDVDVFGRVEYPFDLSTTSAQNNLTYNVGVRVKF